MKKQTTYFICLLALFFSIGNKVIAQIAPPSVYTSLSAGNYVLSDTIGGSEKWYKWTNDSAATHVYFKAMIQGSKYSLANIELYALESGSLTLINNGTLGTDSTINLSNKDLTASNDFYIKVITSNSGCSICDDPAYASYNFELTNLTAKISSPSAVCELVVDGTMDNYVGGCNFGVAATASGYVATAWHGPLAPPATSASPDYFNACAPTPATTYSTYVNTNSNFASNGLCTVGTNTTGGYSGLYASIPSSNPPYREYIYNQLGSPLIPTTQPYHVSLWVRLSCFSRYATKDLNLYFTTSAPTQPAATVTPTGWVPSVITPTAGSLVSFTTSAVDDKTGWTLLTACFTPTAAFTHVTFGNFQPYGTAVTDLDPTGTTFSYSANGNVPNTHSQVSYYYVDNVSVIPLNLIATGAGTLCSGVPTQLNAELECPLANSYVPTYSWSPSAGLSATNIQNPLANPSISTVYTASATIPNADGSTCVITKTVNVDVTSGVTPTLNITPTQTICQGSSATLTVTGASTYTWSTGSNLATITVTPSSTTGYTVTGSGSGAGCTSTISTSVYVIPTLPVTLTSNTTICMGNSATLTASNSITSYTWLPSGSGSSITITPTVTTTYTVQGTNSCGIFNSAIATVSVLPAPGFSVSTTNVCAGSAVSVTSNSVTQINSMNFNYPNPLTPPNSQSPHTYNTPGTYSLQVVASTGLGTCQTNSIIPIVVTTPTTAAMTFTTEPCTMNYTFFVNSGCTGGSYTYYLNVNGIPAANNPTTTGVFPYTFSSSGTYTVTVFSDYDFVFVDYVITVLPVTYPTVSASASPATVCAGQSTTLTASGALTYTWNPGGSTNPLVVNPLTTTVYTVTGANAVGCTDTETVSVTVNSSLSLSVTASPTAICAGNATTLTASGANTYTWIAGPMTNTFAVSPSSTTIYTVIGTNTLGCTGTQTIQVNVTSNPSIGAIPSTYSICPGGSATLTASGDPSYTYTWAPGGSTNTVVVVTPTINTVYTLSATVTGCGVKTATVQIYVTPLSITATASPTSICVGESSTLTAMGASSYTWNPGALISASVVITPNVNGTYIYTVTGATPEGCSGTNTVSIVANNGPSFFVSPSLSSTICATSSRTLTASPGSLNYVWMPGASTGTIIVVTPSTTTVYTVTATSTVTGCSSVKNPTVVVNPFTLITANPSTICSGQTSTLIANGASSYTWSTGSHSSSITVSPSVTTVYTITGADGSCTSSLTLTLTVNPTPTVTALASPTAICSGQSSTLTASGADTYFWNPGGSTVNPLTVNPTSATIYTVIGTTSLGCSNTGTVSVNVLPTPIITITASPTGILCSGSTATLTASGAVSYTWGTGANTSTVSVTMPSVTTTSISVYTVNATGSSGCTKIRNFQIVVYPYPSFSVTASPTVICSGNSSTLTATAVLGTYNYTWAPGPTISTLPIAVSPTSATVYTVSAKNGNCYTTHTVEVNVDATPSISVSASPTIICSGSSSTLTAMGATNYTWNPGGVTTASVVMSPTATTIYTVTGNTGICSTTKTISITVNASPTVSVNSPTICEGSTATLTANGAVTYTWSTTATTQSIAVSPTVTTSYTVTGTGSNSCTNTAVSTVSVVPNTIPGSFSINTATVNVLANGTGTNVIGLTTSISNTTALNFNWQPGGATTPTTNFNLTQPEVISLTVGNTACGSITQSICVNYVSTACSSYTNPVSGGTITTGTYINKTYRIATGGTMTISGNASFGYSIFLMGANSAIVVDPSSYMALSSCTLLSCEGMWQGIVAQNSAASSATVIVKNSIIEDAYKAVSADNSSGAVNVMNRIDMDGSIFNKNYVDISIINNAAYSGTYSLFAVDCQFISNSDVFSPGGNLKCSSYYPPTVIKSRSYAGINTDQAGTVSFTLTNTFRNIVKNKDYGFFFKRTNAAVDMVDFSDMEGTEGSCLLACGTLPTGVAITCNNSNSLTVVPVNTPSVTSVTFSDVAYGIITNKTKNVDVQYADFNAPNQFQASGTLLRSKGKNGIYCIDPNVTLRANYNTFDMIYYPVSVNYSVTATGGSAISSISNNTMTAGSGELLTGIDIAASIAFSAPIANLVAAANTITDVNTGIRLTSVTGGYRLSGNSITVQPGSRAKYGIFLNGNNNDIIVDNNTIDGGLSGSAGSFALNNIGIASISSPGCKIQCNTITNTGLGIMYDGNNSTGTGTGDELFKNTLTYPIRRGLVLQNGAIVGTQGSSSGASANEWNSFPLNGTEPQTLIGGGASSSDGANSVLWAHNNSTELPSDNAFSSPSSLTDRYAISNSNLFTTVSGDITTCPTVLTVGARMSSNTTPTLNIIQRDSDYVRYITTVITPTANAEPEAKWLLKQHMHKSIRKTGLGTNHTVNDFYAAEQNRNVADYYEIDSLLSVGDLVQAADKNNHAGIGNYIEQTHHDFNALLINGISNEQDYMALEAIANLCAYQYGNAVYQARALVNGLSFGNREFIDSCDTDKENRAAFADEEKHLSPVTENKQFKLYPNPNNGNFILSYELKSVAIAKVVITDVTGKNVYEAEIDAMNNFKSIDLYQYSNGMYFIQLLSGNKLLWTDKIMINK